MPAQPKPFTHNALEAVAVMCFAIAFGNGNSQSGARGMSLTKIDDNARSKLAGDPVKQFLILLPGA